MKRRWITIPGIVFAALLLLITVPVWLPVAALFDMALGRRLATVRALTFATAYACAEVAGLSRAMLAGQDPEANYELQRAWALGLWNVAVGLYQLDVHLDGEDLASPGPVLLLPRHSSLADTLLPIALIGPARMRPRYVLKKELLWDPCLDVVGNRVPNAFVQRSGDTENALAGVAALAKDMGQQDAIVLYPEGTRFSPERQARALARLNPERRERCAAWRHVLPPHHGGVYAALEIRKMDVVFCAHRGLEPSANALALLNGSMIGQRIDVSLWRVSASQIPAGRAEQALWLDAMWEEMERRVEAMHRAV